MENNRYSQSRCWVRVQSLVAALTLLGAVALGRDMRQKPPGLEPEMQAELAAWLAEHGAPPERYVVGLFQKHDVVFLGEWHRVKHDVLFVQSLLRPLYDNGVRALVLEFGRREDQPLIDWLVTRKDWDEALAREIVFRSFIAWGYREYVDIYKAAWRLNRQLPTAHPRFRVLAMGDSPDWSIIKNQADRENPEVMRRVWRGGGEDRWAEVVLDAVSAGEKVLVYCGIHHAFTEYRQPVVIDGRFSRFDRSLRAGNHVFNAIGKRAVTVFLHAPWRGYEGYDSPERHPADGVIDALMLALGPRPLGFDLKPGPFGDLRIRDAVYRHGYEDFRLGQFCDGWIYTEPLSKAKGVRPIRGWINADNLVRAQQQSPNPASRQEPAGEFNRGIAGDADIPRRWARLR